MTIEEEKSERAKAIARLGVILLFVAAAGCIFGPFIYKRQARSGLPPDTGSGANQPTPGLYITQMDSPTNTTQPGPIGRAFGLTLGEVFTGPPQTNDNQIDFRPEGAPRFNYYTATLVRATGRIARIEMLGWWDRPLAEVSGLLHKTYTEKYGPLELVGEISGEMILSCWKGGRTLYISTTKAKNDRVRVIIQLTDDALNKQVEAEDHALYEAERPAREAAERSQAKLKAEQEQKQRQASLQKLGL